MRCSMAQDRNPKPPLTSVNAPSGEMTSVEVVAQYIQEWLTAIAPTVKPSTHYSYSRNLRLHVRRLLRLHATVCCRPREC